MACVWPEPLASQVPARSDHWLGRGAFIAHVLGSATSRCAIPLASKECNYSIAPKPALLAHSHSRFVSEITCPYSLTNRSASTQLPHLHALVHQSHFAIACIRLLETSPLVSRPRIRLTRVAPTFFAYFQRFVGPS